MVSWGFLLTKNVHEQDSIFNNTLMIIFFNYTQINLWTLMTRTLHGWLRKQKIKSLKKLNVPVIHFKWQNYYWLPKTTKYWIWNFVNHIKKKKEYDNYLFKKLSDHSTSRKVWWSILKTFYNGIKIPFIPPIFMNNKVVSTFR